jgi:hypothetical protein
MIKSGGLKLWHVFGTAGRREPSRAACSRTQHDELRTKFAQFSGHFRRWWQVLGSNQRRLSRRFYTEAARRQSDGC